MIYYTGDIHGDVRPLLYFISEQELKSEDIVVILGDVGLNYFGNDYGDRRNKKKLAREGVTIFCIHGNHEMRPETISSYHETEWHGGAVYVEDEFPNLIFAKDGEVYDLDGKSAIVMGGAYSVDKYYRLSKGIKWFPDEQPSVAVKKRVENKLNEISWKVDIVLSHTCPAKYTPVEAFMDGINQEKIDHSTEEWLDTIEDRLDYQIWFCGHWHIDKHIDKMHFLMNGYEAVFEKRYSK